MVGIRRRNCDYLGELLGRLVGALIGKLLGEALSSVLGKALGRLRGEVYIANINLGLGFFLLIKPSRREGCCWHDRLVRRY